MKKRLMIVVFVLGFISAKEAVTENKKLLENPGKEVVAEKKKLLENPGFEKGTILINGRILPRGWKTTRWEKISSGKRLYAVKLHDASVIVDSSTAHTGKNSLKIQSLKEILSKIVFSNKFNVSVDKEYTFTVWMKSDNGEITARLLFDGRTKDGKHWYKINPEKKFLIGKEWKKYIFIHEIAEEGVEEINVRIDFMKSKGTLWIDDASVKEK